MPNINIPRVRREADYHQFFKTAKELLDSLSGKGSSIYDRALVVSDVLKLGLTDLDRFLAGDVDLTVSISTVYGEADEIVATDNGDNTYTIGLSVPVGVSKGGTGAETLTENGIVIGNGTGAVTVTSEPTDGQILIGKTGDTPVLATISGTANQTDVSNGGGTITLSFASPTRMGSSANIALGNYSEFEADGTLKFSGDATAYDDLQVSISNVKLPTSTAPTWRDYDHGISGGVTFPVLGFAVNNYLYFDVQSTHSMELSSVLDNHIHYMTPTDGTGYRFQFQLDVIAAPIGGDWAVPTGSPFTREVSMDADVSSSHEIVDIADIPGINTTVSTVYSCKLTRIAATSDEYAGEVYVKFIDCHYKKDTIGSREETSK